MIKVLRVKKVFQRIKKRPTDKDKSGSVLEVKSLSQTTRHAVQKKQKYLAHGIELSRK